jgi:cytochrome o ubiquinol oxidase subunit 1
VGAAVILCGICCQVAQLVVSIRNREALRDVTGDPWNGRSLEWSTPSPPPVFNFAVLPNVEGEEAYSGIKQRAIAEGLVPEPHYQPIEMPHNSPTGFITAFFSTVTGFALIWHIWWAVILGLFGAFATFVWFAWRDQEEYEIPVSEVARIDRERRRIRAEILLPSLGRRA